MRFKLGAFALALGLCVSYGDALAQAAIVITTCGTAAPPAGNSALYIDHTGTLCVSSSGGGGGGSVTQGTVPWVDDITQWANVALGAPSNYGTSPGTVAVPGVNAFITNIPSVTIADGADVTQGAIADAAATAGGTGTVSAKLREATALLNSVLTALGSALPAGGNVIGATIPAPSSSASFAITPVVSSSGESSHVLKGSAGNLYSVYATNLTTTPGFLAVLNATSAPADGAITPLDCIPLPAGGLASFNYNIPAAYSTGITAVVTSASTCFTKTTGVITAFIKGGVQ